MVEAKGETLSDATRYPPDSTKEWADEIMALDQLLAEGFLVKPLSALAEAGGRKLDPNWQALKFMQEALIVKGRREEDAKAIIAPIQRLHGLRTEVKGHATADKKKKAEIDARTKHGNFRAHFTEMASDCEKALNEIISAFNIVIEK
jgi:hypothetical protein